MKNILTVLLCLASATLWAQQQSIEHVLQQIEENNTTLTALKGEAEAEKIGNKTGIYLENPEVEFSYSWGGEDVPGDKTTFSVMQSFDFPTAYYYKNKVSNSQNRQVDLKYRIERKDLLLEAKKVCIELTYINAFSEELEVRYNHAQQIAEAYQIQFDKGNVNIIDLNKAKLNLLNVRKELNTLYAERDFYLAELTRFNGGNPIAFTDDRFPAVSLPSSFDSFFSLPDNLSLLYYQQEILLNKESVKLQRSMNLPKISAGYVSEKVINAEHFQGVSVGLSIPLFENKNTVKQIKVRNQAVMAAEADESIRYRNEMKALYDKAGNYSQILNSYDQVGISDNTAILLKKSLDAGEISLIDYLQELSIYYEVINNRLEVERDLNLTIAEMNQWKL